MPVALIKLNDEDAPFHVRAAFGSKYAFGDKVTADGGDVVMTVVVFMFTTLGVQIQCAWFANGLHHESWFYEWRLKRVD